jgi:hypothetical protein
MMDAFRTIYEKNLWKNSETRSGKGSTLEFTKPLRDALPPLLRELNVHVMVDAGCGDWNWMSKVKLGRIEYHGWDVVEAIVRENIRRHFSSKRLFSVVDITQDDNDRSGYKIPWPAGLDLILCRCCLFHLSNEHVKKALANFRASGARWLLATTHPHEPALVDIPDGKWRRLNLELLLGPAMKKIPDGPGDDGYLGLWGLEGK